MLTSLKSELQDLREQVQALTKIVTEQQEETQSLLHKLIQSSTLNISPSSNGNNIDLHSIVILQMISVCMLASKKRYILFHSFHTDKAKTEMVPLSSANDLTSSTVSNSKSAIVCGPNKDSAYTTMTVTMNEGT